MKKYLNIICLLISVFIHAQTEIEILYKEAEKICNQENNDFCKAFQFFKNKEYDSCYIYSAKALRDTDKSFEGREILNYFQGNSAVEKKLFEQAITNLKEVSDSGEYRNLKISELGYICIEKRKFDEAIVYLDSWLKESNRSRIDLKINVLHNLAVCFMHKKHFNQAETYMIQEADLIQKNDTGSLIASKMDFANIYYEQYLDDKAIPLFEEAYELAKLYSDLTLKRNSTYNMAIVERNRKNFEKSIGYFQEFNKWKDSIWNRDKIWELTEKDKQAALAQKENELLVKQEELKRQKLIKWFTVSIALFFIGILLLIFKWKQKNTRYQNYIQTMEKTNQERERISKELHDGVLGKLFGIRFGLGFLSVEGSDKIIEKYQYFLDELKDIEEEIRDVSHKLNIPIKDGEKLEILIEKLLKEKSTIANFEYQFAIPNPEVLEQLNADLQTNILRILQEAIHNIVKHAKANNVLVQILTDNNIFILKVKDDGIGFDNDKNAENVKGIGLKNMKARANNCKGKFTITSDSESGTVLIFEFPFTLKAGKRQISF